MEVSSDPEEFRDARAVARWIREFFLDPDGGIEASLRAEHKELEARRKAGDGPGVEPPRPYMERDNGSQDAAD